MPKIAIVHDPEIDTGGAGKRHTVKIDAVRRDGTSLSTVKEQRRGSADHPLPHDEVVAKFRRLAAVALSSAAIDELIELHPRARSAARDLQRLTALISSAAR